MMHGGEFPNSDVPMRLTAEFTISNRQASDPEWRAKVLAAQDAIGPIIGAELHVELTPPPVQPESSELDPKTERLLAANIIELLTNNAATSPNTSKKMLTQVSNCLATSGLLTVRSVLAAGQSGLLDIRGLGGDGADIVMDTIKNLNLSVPLVKSPTVQEIAAFCTLDQVPGIVLLSKDSKIPPAVYSLGLEEIAVMPLKALAKRAFRFKKITPAVLEEVQSYKELALSYSRDFARQKGRN